MTERTNHEPYGAIAAGPASLRLLPWATPEGKPCFLSTDDEGGMLSRIADEVEGAQTASAAAVIAGAQGVLDDPLADTRSLRFALTRASEALTDLVRIAESRGVQVAPPEGGEHGEGQCDGEDGPKSPAES